MEFIKKSLLFFITVFLLVSQSYARDTSKCLVLGFNSCQLTDLEDRMLRETLMRELKAQGFTVVKVMDIENLIHEGQIDIRRISPADMKTVMPEFKPDLVISGRIFPSSGSKKEKKLIKGSYYCFEALIYNRKKDRFFRVKKKAVYRDSLLSFFSDLSSGLVKNIKPAY